MFDTIKKHSTACTLNDYATDDCWCDTVIPNGAKKLAMLTAGAYCTAKLTNRGT